MDLEKFKETYVEAKIVYPPRIYINELSKADRLTILKTHPDYIKRIKEPTEEEMLIAVTHNGTFIRYIEHPTPAVEIASFKNLDCRC